MNRVIQFSLPSTLFLISSLLLPSHGEIGTAAHYGPPYLPTECYGTDTSQFPSSNQIAAAGDGVWDNGASCGRRYLVRCISATKAGTCEPGRTIQVTVVDYALKSRSTPSNISATIVLSEAAFSSVADLSASLINIEFQQV